MSWNVRIVDELCRRAMTRYHAKVTLVSNSRVLFWYNGRHYVQDDGRFGYYIACEESRAYKEFEKGAKTWLHVAIGEYIVGQWKDGTDRVSPSERQRILQSKPMPVFADTTRQSSWVKNACALGEIFTPPDKPPMAVCLADCIITVENEKVRAIPHSPNFFFLAYIDIKFNVSQAYYIKEYRQMKGYLLDWGAKRQDVADLLQEIYGACIRQGSGSKKAFFLEKDTAGNGKSTYQNSIRALLGNRNISAVPIQSMQTDFNFAMQVGKFANLVDDMSKDYVGDISNFKSIVTGAVMTANNKYGKVYTVFMDATQIYACNKMPRLGDNTNGMGDRVVTIPFDMRFRDTDEEIQDFQFDNFFDKPQTRRALLQLAIEGLQRVLLNNGQYTKPKCVTEVTEQFKADNLIETDSTWAYIQHKHDSYEYLSVWDSKSMALIYDEYVAYTLGNGGKHTIKSHVFSKEWLKHLGEYYYLHEMRPRGKKSWKQVRTIDDTARTRLRKAVDEWQASASIDNEADYQFVPFTQQYEPIHKDAGKQLEL